MEKINLPTSNNNNLEPKEKTFNKLQRIQNLLKKESALKKLCKLKLSLFLILNIVIKQRDETKNQIGKQCKKMYIEKLKVMNMISDRVKHDNKVLELVDIEDDKNILGDLKIYIPYLMFSLWEKPKIMALILQNADINDVKNYLADFIVNNFYENILSSNFIEENLIYVLTMLLNEEINSLLYVEQHVNFLDDTCCGCLLEELRKKKDIQTFFKNVITESIENLEKNFSNFKFNFNIEKIYSNHKEESKNKIKMFGSNFEEKEISKINEKSAMQIQSEKKKFYSKYMSFLNKVSLEQLVTKNNLDTEKSLYGLYFSQINNVSENDQFLYSNKQLILEINKYENSEILLYQYHKNFTGVTNFINSILDKIIEYFNLIPYSIKVFCKIILLMVEQKFPDITKSEKIIFLAKFFFGRLLIPILRNPGTEAFINSIIISENTLNNLQIICDIIKKFVAGDLYTGDNSEYTPFNWYFIEQSEKIYKIFEYATNVSLPSFIEGYINNNLPSDFEYNYFQQNKDELINFRSIFFNIHEALALINTMENCSSEIFEYPDTNNLKKVFEKLKSKNCKKMINDIIKKEKLNEAKYKQINIEKCDSDDIEIIIDDIKSFNQEKNGTIAKQKIYYFLLTSLLASETYNKLFEISQPTKSFSIQEIKDDSNNNENITKNDIIKVKNFICSLLYNFDKLVENNFNPDKIENTEKILNELNTLMKSSYFVIDGTIPFDWYINSIYEYLKKIPENLTKNDCEELYKEIENDINNSLTQLDFIKLSYILEKLEFAERGKIFYKENQKLLMEIKLKEEVKEIIYKEFIPVSIKFSWNNNDSGIFQIKPAPFKINDRNNIKKINDYQNSQKVILAFTIDDFTKKFPNLIVYQEYQDADLFLIQEKLDFAENFENYFNMVFNRIKSYYKNAKNDYKNIFELVRENIFDYVMSKIYDKIFPIEVNQIDSKLYNNSIKLSWVKTCHFLGDKKQYVLGSFINDVNKYSKLLLSEKSTRKKLINLDKIMDNISFFYKFNDKKNIGVDDIIPVLTFAIIKTHPFFFDSNIKYMKMYSKLGKFFNEGNKIEQFEAAINFIVNIKYSHLKGVTKEEFFEKQKNMKIDFK